MTQKVYVQNWIESERGWGQRPDGFTIHTSKEDRDEYVEWYNQKFNNKDTVPDEYTRAEGAPIEVEVTGAFFQRIKNLNKKTKGGGYTTAHGKARFFDRGPLKISDLDL